MTDLFNGLAGALNDTFGAPVTYWTLWGEERSIQAIFRDEPIREFERDGGSTMVVAPILRVPATLAGDLERGVRVLGPDGNRYRIQSKIPSEASPANDAFQEYRLETDEP